MRIEKAVHMHGFFFLRNKSIMKKIFFMIDIRLCKVNNISGSHKIIISEAFILPTGAMRISQRNFLWYAHCFFIAFHHAG